MLSNVQTGECVGILNAIDKTLFKGRDIWGGRGSGNVVCVFNIMKSPN